VNRSRHPNWVATGRRRPWRLLGQFAITESKRVPTCAGVSGMPRPWHCRPARKWLKQHDMWLRITTRRMVPWTVKKFHFGRTSSCELVDSIIGDHYPVPDRMLVHNEQIVHEYLQWAMRNPRPKGTFKSTRSSGTAAMCASLRH
jgi:aspartate 4-decarboxylase